jgi:leader peptidase (prepilin peptidase)/N-methyltransferase
MRWEDFWSALATGVGLAVFLGIIWLVTRGKGMGEGDLHLALPMGILLGWPRGLVGMYTAFIIGAVYGLTVLLLRKKKWKQRVPFGPFLVLGTVVALIWGGELWEMVYGMMM